MNTRRLIAVPAVACATILASSTMAGATGGDGASRCSESGRVEMGGQTVIDTFGHVVVAPTVREGDGFAAGSNPGSGFDWWEGEAGDGPVVPGVCIPQG